MESKRTSNSNCLHKFEQVNHQQREKKGVQVVSFLLSSLLCLLACSAAVFLFCTTIFATAVAREQETLAWAQQQQQAASVAQSKLAVLCAMEDYRLQSLRRSVSVICALRKKTYLSQPATRKLHSTVCAWLQAYGLFFVRFLPAFLLCYRD